MDTSVFKNGFTFLWDGKLFTVLEFMNVPKPKGGSLVQAKLYNLRNGSTLNYNFTGSEKIEEVTVEKREMSYIYDEGDNAVFMNNETYEQIEIPKSQIERELQFIIMGNNVQVRLYEGEVLGLILPDKVTLQVTDTPLGEKGNSATNTLKEATLETGLVIRVPMFINTGDYVIINTETGKYDSRAKD